MCLQFDKEKKIQQENGFEKTVQHFPFLLKSNVSWRTQWIFTYVYNHVPVILIKTENTVSTLKDSFLPFSGHYHDCRGNFCSDSYHHRLIWSVLECLWKRSYSMYLYSSGSNQKVETNTCEIHSCCRMCGWFVLLFLCSIPYQIYQIFSLPLLLDISRIWLFWINCYKNYVHIFWYMHAHISLVYIHSSGISWSLMTLAKIWNRLLSFSYSPRGEPLSHCDFNLHLPSVE